MAIETKKHEIIKERVQGDIQLILDSYDDIFSDFDPRPYSGKALSDDFLAECKRASHDKTGDGEILFVLMVPKEKRSLRDEAVIKKRMTEHFHKHYQEKHSLAKTMKKEGLLWIFAGSMLVLVATAIYEKQEFLYKFFVVVLEPAGWFSMWNGFDRLALAPGEKVPDYTFYEKMSRARIRFECFLQD
jgi:hypothetical protein